MSVSVLVTGSVAVDYIMTFPDHFKNHLIADKLDKLNVAFHVFRELAWKGELPGVKKASW